LLSLTTSPFWGRLAVVNHFKRQFAEYSRRRQFPGLMAFLSKNFFAWIFSYVAFAGGRKFPFPGYPKERSGIYPMAAPAAAKVTLAIAGDWATGTHESAEIARHIEAKKLDWTIHLGDVYYVGDEAEVRQNCLNLPEEGFTGVCWPHGSGGSFALNGNHEMYANGKPYFQVFLPTLGPKGDPHHQPASFFCLEADHWRIIAIDTGYNSTGKFILSQIPGLNKIPAIGGDCHLEDKLIAWLRDVVKPQENPKATLLLSHNQYYSAFEQQYFKPAQQMAEFFKGRELVWIWGHEHRLAIYDKFSPEGSILAYGRCLGHGGMPIELATPDTKRAPLLFYDKRAHSLGNAANTMVGENGYLLAAIEGETLTLDYRDVADTPLFWETFSPLPNGTLKHNFENKGILVSPST